MPKSPFQWSSANDFFKLTFSNHAIKPYDLNDNMNTMATVIYNYFSEIFGFVDNNYRVEFEQKYQIFSAKDLKKALKKLKLEDGNNSGIKFVAKRLHTLVVKHNNSDQLDTNTYESAEINCDRLINVSFWGYVKRYFKKNTSSFPTFNLTQCTSYFPKTFSAINPHKIFSIPSWIPKFASPQIPFKLDSPTY